VLFVAKLFSSLHKGTKTLRTNNKIKSFLSLCLGGKYFWFPEKSGFPLCYNQLVQVKFIEFTKSNVMICSDSLLLEERIFFNSNSEWPDKKNNLMKLFGLGDKKRLDLL
jgi:hypothetical protein